MNGVLAEIYGDNRCTESGGVSCVCNNNDH